MTVELTRRDFLQGCVAGSGALLVAACGGGSSGGPAATSGSSVALPANSHLAPPDLPWTDHNIPLAYFKLPAPFRATSGTPGAGGPLSEVTWFSDLFSAPPPPAPGNRYWADLNRRLGVTVTPVWAASDPSSFQQKFAALLASGDLPDLVLFGGTVGTTTAAAQVQAVQQGAFTDLTSHLTGSALDDYPNLALIAPKIWQNARINGRTYGVPRGRTVPGTSLLLRFDWAQKVGVPIAQITSSDTFREALVDFGSRDPDNNWRLNRDGTLTKDIETTEFREAIAFGQDLFKRGAFHPDAAAQTLANHYSLFEGGRVGAYLDALYASGQTRPFLAQLGFKDAIRHLLPPAGPGRKAVTFNAAGYNGMVMIPSKVGKDSGKVRQLLKILDYFASPFGSEEYTFLNYGIEGVHFTRSANGNPARNAQGTTDIGDLFRLLTPPNVNYAAGSQYFSDADQEAWTRLVDQAYGYVSASSLRRGPTLNQLVVDSVKALVSGRTPMSGFNQFVQTWRSQGGDQVRKELQQAIHQHR
ncbi:MAG: extracellular solute-binding protein [Chloroflexi bacterium]|nr:MAG: extracellular solute-binding protein [Chloroflexota bacterium]